MVEILGSGSSSQAEKETQEKASSLTETLKLSAGKSRSLNPPLRPRCSLNESLLPVSQTFFSKPPGGLYSLPYLSKGLHAESATLSRAEWWEILFFIKKLEPKQQQEINSILLQSLDDQVKFKLAADLMTVFICRMISGAVPARHRVCPQEAELDDSSLIGLSVPGDVAKKLLHHLKQKLPSSCLSDLLCSHAFDKHYLKRGGARLEDEELLGEKTNTTSPNTSSTYHI